MPPRSKNTKVRVKASANNPKISANDSKVFEAIGKGIFQDFNEIRKSYDTALDIVKESGNDMTELIRAGLQLDAHKWLISEPTILEIIGSFAPEVVQACLLEYIGTLSRKDELLMASVTKMSQIGPYCDLNKFKQVAIIIDDESKMLLIEHSPKFLNITREQAVRDLIQVVEDYWTNYRGEARQRIFSIFTWVDCPEDLFPVWRGRAEEDFGYSLNEFLPVLTFLLKSCTSVEAGQKCLRLLEEKLNIHHLSNTSHRMEPQKKRPRAVVINESSYSLNDVIGAIHNCKYFLSALYGIEDIKNSGIVAMCLILACVSKEHKSIIRVLRRAEQQFDECQAIIEEALALILQNGDNLNLILKLATSCDQAKLHKISSLFIISALRYADRYDAKDLINELTSQMTDSMTSSNFRLFDNASKEFPELICEHQRSFRIIFDHIDRLKPDNLRTFYECMIRLAVFSYIQQGDTLHWNDLLMIIRKQVSSVDPPVRMFGSVALVAMTLIIFTDEVGEAGEASCSQAPTLRRLVHQEKFIESYLELLTLALSTDNCDIPSVVHLCKEIVQILPGLNLAVIKKINRRISSLFENGFIFELQHQHQQQIHHSLDGDETLIGLGNSSMQATFMMPFVFHLLQHTEKLSNGGILDNIDALLGCPVMGPDDGDTCERISSVSLSNWIRSLINAFYDQEDKDIQSKCLLRLSLLQKCSSNMSTTKIDTKEIVNVDHESTLDLKCYDEEFLRSLNLSQKVSLSKTDTTKEILPEQLIIHLNPGVIVKYSHQTGEVREFILKEILTVSKLSTWEDTDIINVLAGTKMDLQVTVHLIEELTRRESTCPLLEMINSIINGVDCANLSGDQMCCLVKLCQMVPGVDRQALISETLINFIFSPECSTPDAGQLLEGLCALHDDSVEFITLMMSRLSTSEFTVWKKKLSLHAGLSASLSRIKQEHVPVIIGGIKLFDRIVQMGRGGIETGFAEATFKYGKVFLERLTKDAIPVLQGKFLDHRQEILESFKPLQCATRSLQIMCNHLKPQRLPKYKNLLPPLKRSLEALLYGVKRLLQVNNCLSAFWIGNLKHRTIDGAETNSQVPIEISESEEEEPDVEKCDTESECDIGV